MLDMNACVCAQTWLVFWWRSFWSSNGFIRCTWCTCMRVLKKTVCIVYANNGMHARSCFGAQVPLMQSLFESAEMLIEIYIALHLCFFLLAYFHIDIILIYFYSTRWKFSERKWKFGAKNVKSFLFVAFVSWRLW